jgi:hypothetical protein
MDDLSFRKAVYADPFSKDPELLKAAEQDPKRKSFWNEIKAMENELQSAMNIPVPENLAEKLILRQSLTTHTEKKKQQPWYLALAASVMLATVLTVGVMNTGNNAFANDVFAHMDHVDAELAKNAAVDLNAINAKLASFNGQVNGDLGEVLSANYCYLDKIKSLHLIVRGENGLTSLFVVPDSITESAGESFSNATFSGASFLLESAKIIVVGESKDDVSSLEQRAKRAMLFSA